MILEIIKQKIDDYLLPLNGHIGNVTISGKRADIEFGFSLAESEIKRLKGLVDDAFNAGYDNGAYANDSDLQANYEPPMTLEQFKKENKL